jgi:homoserine dehydrogenase
MRAEMTRISVVGLGTVGQWLLRALDSGAERIARRHGVTFTVVGVANSRDGFVYDGNGLDIPAILGLSSSGRSIAEQPGARHWPSAIEGLRASEADVLVEVTGSPVDGEPGFAHMREAIARGTPVVTSNKWPVALHGVELAQLAGSGGVAFRAESTVMSGTPVLAPLVEGLAGTRPIAVRGILNATSNFILSAMADGRSYDDALAEAEAAGLAERGVQADIDGSDAMAKTMILAGLVFGRQLRPEQVLRRGIDAVTRSQVDEARSAGGSIRHVATLEFSEPEGAGEVDARVEPMLLLDTDPLAAISGTTNAIICRADPVGDVTIIGPGAGLELAGQGVLSDLIAVARARDTEPRVCPENVEAVKRTIEAYNRRDVGALLDELDPEIEWRPSLPVLLGGDETVYRGHDGARQLLRDLDEVLAERQLDLPEICDEGERVVARGNLRIRGKSSGALTESPFTLVAEFKKSRAVRIHTYLD